MTDVLEGYSKDTTRILGPRTQVNTATFTLGFQLTSGHIIGFE